jgi:intraflagellar transport protein 80
VVATVDAYVTSIAWAPDFGARSSVFAVSCTDGTVRFYSMAGGSTAREDKKVAAHTGAVIAVKWSPDGSALMSSGEDGDVKLWSKSGNLRSTLAQNAAAVYAFVWGPDGDSVLWASGKALSVKSASGSGRKPLSWRAHEETVLCVDWNRITDLVVSGGEDCVYKVWDSHGRQLYSAPPGAHVITSVAWMPSGDAFAVGSFQSLRLCDKTGWSHARDRPQVGSVLALAWTADGTEVAGAGGSGGVVFGQLVQRRAEWGALEAVQAAPKLIVVSGVEGTDEAVEHLEFPRDRVVEFALGYGKLVVATTSQCFLYATTNLNTPHIFDLRAPVQLILLAETVFLMMDASGINVYNYQVRARARVCGGGEEWTPRPQLASLSPTFYAQTSRSRRWL